MSISMFLIHISPASVAMVSVRPRTVAIAETSLCAVGSPVMSLVLVFVAMGTTYMTTITFHMCTSFIALPL